MMEIRCGQSVDLLLLDTLFLQKDLANFLEYQIILQTLV